MTEIDKGPFSAEIRKIPVMHDAVIGVLAPRYTQVETGTRVQGIVKRTSKEKPSEEDAKVAGGKFLIQGYTQGEGYQWESIAARKHVGRYPRRGPSLPMPFYGLRKRLAERSVDKTTSAKLEQLNAKYAAK